jgi:hypothetical protein
VPFVVKLPIPHSALRIPNYFIAHLGNSTTNPKPRLSLVSLLSLSFFDPNLEAQGRAEKWEGKVRRKVGDVEKVFED